MAAPIPAALKSADISRFALRAAQLEKVKPIISYWCNYWIVNQIISNNLQNTDEESKLYTINVMDKLEQFKDANSDNDAVIDDLAGKAYIEQFGLETFQRADNAVRADKASRQTADTFQASATFLELLQIFGPIDPEIATKIKYAKYHALRIAKAIKAGEDPNLSNPKPEPIPEEQGLPLDSEELESVDNPSGFSKPRQPSVQEIPDEADRIQRSLSQKSTLDESIHPSRASSVPRPPGAKVEDAIDESDRLSRTLARQSTLDESLHPSRQPSIPRTVHVDPTSGPASGPLPEADTNGSEGYYTASRATISPGIPPVESKSDPKSSSGGNYFPRVPTPPAPSLELPSAPQDFTSFPPPLAPSLPSQTSVAPSQQTMSIPPPQSFYNTQPAVPQPPVVVSQPQRVPAASNVPEVLDEEAMLTAQKHARWAISALNFEDVGTAIKELRGALEALGAK
ncbi:hypothetical protein UCRPC4_g02170 [Phaeomoniella chlamydospora]|uniref:DUF605-domain-containing protein n=1 Tax=Phaeomoniella chlamydospora TaxID=158046 RepID=A0A0G2ERY3_PHACM|nr:hypothetical protein UCRPC4_g02170 [Phaeomoniella chlamydospora]